MAKSTAKKTKYRLDVPDIGAKTNKILLEQLEFFGVKTKSATIVRMIESYPMMREMIDEVTEELLVARELNDFYKYNLFRLIAAKDEVLEIEKSLEKLINKKE